MKENRIDGRASGGALYLHVDEYFVAAVTVAGYSVDWLAEIVRQLLPWLSTDSSSVCPGYLVMVSIAYHRASSPHTCCCSIGFGFPPACRAVGAATVAAHWPPSSPWLPLAPFDSMCPAGPHLRAPSE